MEHGPLPPHERSWRHPSEIAAEERRVVESEPGPSALRSIALAGGTLGLLAIGLAVLSLTPREYGAPVRLASPVPLDDLAESATTFAALRSGSPASPPTTVGVPATLRRHGGGPPATPATPAAPPLDDGAAPTTATGGSTSGTTSTEVAAEPMADPIGASGYALIRTDPSSLLERHSTVDVELPTGDRRTALTIASTELVTLVAIDASVGSRVATSAPHATDPVTVTSDGATSQVPYGRLVASPAPTAAIVTDASGAVVGVCADDEGSAVFVPIVAGELTSGDAGAGG